MRLLKNKKAMDYSAFMVIVVIIAIGFLFYNLYTKLDAFEMRIGEQEVALLKAYNDADNLLLYTDQSAKYSVWNALNDLAENAGEKPNVLPVFANNGFPYLYKDGEKLYKEIDIESAFEHYLNMYLNVYLSKYPSYVPKDNYEFLITENKIIGIPVKPVLLNIFTEAERKEKYGEVMRLLGSDLKIDTPTGLGVYVVRPSFSLDINTHLEIYNLLFQKTDILLDCLKADTVQNCIDSVNSNDLSWYFTEIPDNIIAFNVVFNNIENPYTKEKVFARFVLELQ